MIPPRFKQFTAEQYAGAASWFTTLFLPQLSESMSSVVNGLNKGLNRANNLDAAEVTNIQFTTKTPASATWPMKIKNTLGHSPKHVHIGQIYRYDKKPMANAFALSWVLDSSRNIAVTVLGLEDGTKYVMSINYE